MLQFFTGFLHFGQMVYFLTNKFLLQKFQPEKYDFELYKDYLHEENGPNSPDFEGKKIPYLKIFFIISSSRLPRM